MRLPSFLKGTGGLFILPFVFFLFVSVTSFPGISHAQAATSTPPTDKYAEEPVCPKTVTEHTSGTCTYPTTHDTTTCTYREYPVTSPGSHTYYCNNKDTSKTQCDYFVSSGEGGYADTAKCVVTNADGSVRNSVSTGSGTLGPTSTTTCTGTQCQTSTADSPGIFDGIASAVANIAASIAEMVARVILSLAAVVLGIVGTIFNWSVYVTVFQFGNLVGNSAGMLAAWSVLRDVGNIFLLFGFIFMGIQTILNINHYNVNRSLARFIIFAVLLNFSLLAAETIIDTSNVFASVLYNQSGVCTGADKAACQADTNLGIAGKVMEAAGISNIFHLDAGNAETFAGTNSTAKAVILIGLALFVSITAVVLLAASIMLITRAVVLAFLMVLSPIGFAGMAIPQLAGLAKEWWDKLLSQAFFAPVYLLMVFVSLKLMDGVRTALGSGTGDSASLGAIFSNSSANATTTNFSIAFTFTLLIGFMIGSLMVAKKMGATGADFAVKTAGGVVGGATVGVAAFVARRTFGAAGAATGNLVRRQEWAQKHPNLARIVVKLPDMASKASFDVRTSSAGQALGGATGIDFGKPNKTAGHGFHGIEEKAVKEREEFLKTLKPTADQTSTKKALEEELKEKKKIHDAHMAPFLKEIDDATKYIADRKKAKNDPIGLAAGKVRLQEAINDYRQQTNTSTKGGKQKGAFADESTALKNLEKEIKAWGTIAENKKIDAIAASLEKSHHDAQNIFNPMRYTVGPHADHEAAENLRKNQGKSGTDKAFESLKKELEKQTKNEEDHHEEDEAHAKHAERTAASAAHAPAASHDTHADTGHAAPPAH